MQPTIVFTDGAASGNPGPGGWGVIIATPDGQVVELGGGDRQTTNNRMEIAGAIHALRYLERTPGAIDLYTDSTYVIRGITQWIWGWRKRGWKTAEGGDVANVDQWKELSALLGARGKENPVNWRYVRGHSGVPGNERVDEIAVSYTKGRRATLYRGPLLKYDVAVHDIPENSELPEMRQKEEKKAAYSYLSLVNGSLKRHTTWKECESVVKGRPGAKFKKAMTAENEAEILAEWGLSPKDIEN